MREDAGWASILYETNDFVLTSDWMTLDPRMSLEADIAWHWFGFRSEISSQLRLALVWLQE